MVPSVCVYVYMCHCVYVCYLFGVKELPVLCFHTHNTSTTIYCNIHVDTDTRTYRSCLRIYTTLHYDHVTDSGRDKDVVRRGKVVLGNYQNRHVVCVPPTW